MTTTALKTSIKKQLNDIENETILRSIHAMLKEVLHSNEDDSMLSKAQKVELDKTLHEHKTGKLNYYTIEQARDIVLKKSKK